MKPSVHPAIGGWIEASAAVGAVAGVDEIWLSDILALWVGKSWLVKAGSCPGRAVGLVLRD